MAQTRREFLTSILKTGALVSLSPNIYADVMWRTQQQRMNTPGDEHFFLFICPGSPSGLDFTYMFDSRPLEMTANKKLQNYRKPAEPIPWIGVNGQATLTTEIINPLLPLKSYFSVINGVTMSALDGHEQNLNFLHTGNTFGGESFIPQLNEGDDSRPLDAIESGKFFVSTTNASRMVLLTPPGAVALINKLKAAPPIDSKSEAYQYLQSRFLAAAQERPNGAFSIGASRLHDGFAKAPDLASMIERANVKPDDTNANFVTMLGEFFKNGAVRSATMALRFGNDFFDTHDPNSAKKQPELYQKLTESLAEIINGLRNTPFDDKRSLYDVTTFMFAPEFSRTMRQQLASIDDTGTDHNQFCNSVLIGGKGINGGLVLGASDYHTSDEKLSAAHTSFDRLGLKIFARPFDFKNFQPRQDLPADYVLGDYLNINSVINTIYKNFSIESTKWRLIERNATIAPVLDPLLKA